MLKFHENRNMVKNYFLAVAAVSFLVCLVSDLLPKTGVGNAARFIGSLILVLSVITPITQINPEDISAAISQFHIQTVQRNSGIEVNNQKLIAELIKDQCEAYVLNKAEEQGMDISVDISVCVNKGDYPYPETIRFSGTVSQADRQYIMDVTERDLGIPQSRQEWK